MPFIITFHDDPDVFELKTRLRADHIAYVARHAPRILAAGGLFPDDADFPDGGVTILDTEDRNEAVDYIEKDPFFVEGVFSTYTIHRWKKAIWDYQRVSAPQTP